MRCPCGMEIDVPVECEVRLESGLQFIDFHPDYTDLDLACYCPLDRACHADTLLTLANGDDDA